MGGWGAFPNILPAYTSEKLLIFNVDYVTLTAAILIILTFVNTTPDLFLLHGQDKRQLQFFRLSLTAYHKRLAVGLWPPILADTFSTPLRYPSWIEKNTKFCKNEGKLDLRGVRRGEEKQSVKALPSVL